MKTQAEFRSNKFPPYEGEEELINPGLWGKRLDVKKIDATTQLTRLTTAMQEVLAADPEIKDVVWAESQ